MRLYVAGPMTGRPQFNYPAFHEAKALLVRAGYEVESPTDGLPIPDGTTEVKPYEWYLRKDLGQLLKCQGVAYLPGTPESNGARLEVHVAAALRMEIKSVSAWLSEATP